MKCPICGCINFYVKDPDDEYETYPFTVSEGNVCFPHADSDAPAVEGKTPVHCDDCTWKGCLDDISGK